MDEGPGLMSAMSFDGSHLTTVTSRVREIGVRIALGATRAAVVQMIVRDGLRVAVPGVLIGIPCAFAAARLVRSQLYGLAPNDPATIVGAAVVFILTGFVAALVPACRASKIDPMDALRHWARHPGPCPERGFRAHHAYRSSSP